jgi:DnaK suppressor protein
VRDDIDLNYFKHRLEQRLADLTAAARERRKNSPGVELDQSRVGRLSRMDAMQHQAMSQATARLAGLEVQRIKSALERMAAGDYGYCVICGDDIAVGRLRFDPSVVSCITCAEAAEEQK